MRTARLALLWIVALLPGELTALQEPPAPPPGEIQREIQASRRRLEEIRSERARLQSEMGQLRTRARNVSSELRNIERQLSASRSVMAEIDFQLEANTDRVLGTTTDLVRARERLRERNAILLRRLRDIYKQGPLHEARVLLSARSFPDLVNRYRYLTDLARYDRLLVREVQEVEVELAAQNEELRSNMAELAQLRRSKLNELAELQQVEAERQRTLAAARSGEQQARTRLEQLEEDERRMASLIEDLDRRRIEMEAREAAAGAVATVAASLSGSDAGQLPWPVSGELVYRFGRDPRPNGTVLRWNGIGIRAPQGTPVRAVRGGRVMLAGPFEGYGPTVVLSHGDGYYTLYLYLEELGVVEGRTVQTGQVVGTVGGSGTPEGSRLEFQIRVPGEGGAPVAADPLAWLSRAGSR